MWIKKIILKNFQRHKNIELDFINGVNIIHGASDRGKSSIRRAIEWVIENKSIDGVRKTGSKKTSVRIIFNNNIEVERQRSTSINRYILVVDGKEQIFDSVGRSIPEEIQDAIGIYPIKFDGEEIYLNSQNQIALPFLMDKSPSSRHKLFNKLTGNDILDKLFSQFNKDILRIKRKKSFEKEEVEKREVEIKYQNKIIDKKRYKHNKCKENLTRLKKRYEKYSKLLEIKELDKDLREKLKATKDKLSSINIPEPNVIKRLTNNIDRFNELKKLKNSLEKTDLTYNRVRGDLDKIKPVSLDLGEITGKISRLDTLKSLKANFDDLNSIKLKTIDAISSIKKELDISINNYKGLLKEMKVCPLCNNEITEKCLEEIK